MSRSRRARLRARAPAGSSFLGGAHAVSDDGRKVIFEAEAPAFGSVPAFGRSFRDQVVVRDLVSGQTTLVSAAPDGSPANDFAFRASLDAAGRHVAFLSGATNLVGDPNPDARRSRVCARSRDRRGDARGPYLGGGAAGRRCRGGHDLPGWTPPRVRVRSSDAPGTPANDRAGHVYVVDLATGTTVLADRAGDGTPGNDRAFHADISDDGSRVAFESLATNLGAGAPASASALRARPRQEHHHLGLRSTGRQPDARRPWRARR